MSTKDLTKRQIAILQFIIQQVELKGYPPSVREIGLAVGLQSSSTVHSHLTQLEYKGYIMRDPTKPRAIMILKDVQGEPLHDDKDTANFLPGETSDETYALSQIQAEEMVNLPLLGNVAAGMPIFAEENIEDTFSFPARFVPNSNAFMLKIRGESMINVGIMNGDYVVVSPQKVAQNGEIVIAMIDGEATCKTYYREKNRIRLQPENDSMDPIYSDHAEIIGKVVSLFRTMH